MIDDKTHKQVADDANDDLELTDEHAGSVAGGGDTPDCRKAGEQPQEYLVYKLTEVY